MDFFGDRLVEKLRSLGRSPPCCPQLSPSQTHSPLYTPQHIAPKWISYRQCAKKAAGKPLLLYLALSMD
jgi:hypothetical protein